jgi:hypothetical protein
MIDKDGFEWGERADSISQVVLFTNRNIMVYNLKGNQIPFYQKSVSCYSINKKIAQEIADKAEKFFIARWTEWFEPITKKEFEYLLGLRTRAMDLAEATDENQLPY